MPKYKLTPNSDDLHVLFVASRSDVAVVRIDNGEIVKEFTNLFFVQPTNRNVQNLLLDISENNIYLINDGAIYTLIKSGGTFVDPPSWNYRLASPAAASFSPLVLVFDELSRSLVRFGNNAYSPYNDASTTLKTNNLNADIRWMEGYNYPRWRILTLLKGTEPDGETFLVEMANDYGGSNTLTGSSRVISRTFLLPHADKWAGNFTYEIIYFAHGNKLYRANINTDPISESLQITLPEGEVVTCMQHMVKPIPQSGSTVTKDYLAVATHSAGHYKVYLFTMEVGNLVPVSPAFEGEGRVTCINYVQPDGGIRVF
ncbi:MAG: hypothetical protein LBP56_04225 [Odoribacteraceae bacterium]|nr:hypothetical protein [Odoribacteraceae bacterium]